MEKEGKWNLSKSKKVVFIFPCVGDHYLNMGKKLYETETKFREHVDGLCRFAEPLIDMDFREILYHESKNAFERNEYQLKLDQVGVVQPVSFITEYALAMLLISKGIKPDAMIGQSLGEYTAASISGVMVPEDALSIIIRRARIIQELPEGSMTVTLLSEKEITPMLWDKLSIAVVASPYTCTVGGPSDAVAEFEKKLEERGVPYSRFGGSAHALHTTMMEPAKDKFIKIMKTIPLAAPQIPYISNVTGKWITDKQTTNPEYWFEQTCRAVRLADGIGELIKNREIIFIEVGPGQALSSYVRQHPEAENFSGNFVFQTMPRDNDVEKEQIVLSGALTAIETAIQSLNAN